MNLALFAPASSRLVHLAPVDMVIIVFYFALVLMIGLYLKTRTNTSEDFFLAGREMTAWIAGLAFLSANLGSLELILPDRHYRVRARRRRMGGLPNAGHQPGVGAPRSGAERRRRSGGGCRRADRVRLSAACRGHE